MEFKLPYLLAMRAQAPKMFNQLRQSGEMEQHLAAKAQEATALYETLAAGFTRDSHGLLPMNEATMIEEQVRAMLIDFPQGD
ncbi:hypothetical protein [Dongia sp. agr-C8]